MPDSACLRCVNNVVDESDTCSMFNSTYTGTAEVVVDAGTSNMTHGKGKEGKRMQLQAGSNWRAILQLMQWTHHHKASVSRHPAKPACDCVYWPASCTSYNLTNEGTAGYARSYT